MKTIYKKILPTILSLSSLAIASPVTAQTTPVTCLDFKTQEAAQAYLKSHPASAANLDLNQNRQACESLSSRVASGLLTEEKWQAIALRYYRSRYRTQFKPDNHLLSLWEVQDLLGFRGIRTKTEKNNPYQYWSWRDRHNPSQKIEAVFVYHQLVSLKAKGFNRVNLKQLKMEIIKQN